jgi:non-specific serine/threonine protein kinase
MRQPARRHFQGASPHPAAGSGDKLTLVPRRPDPETDPRRPGQSSTEPSGNDRTVFRLEGEFWTVTYTGRILRLADSVGLRHLAQLLWHPQREFHAIDLMRALAAAGLSRAGRPPRTDAPAIDAGALAAYRQRLRDLEEELTEAEAREDLGRTDAIRRERDAIVFELRHGARGRELKRDAERARIAVTKALKVALSRIRAIHPDLGSHLDASLKRGYVCVYRPDPRCPIRWNS